MKKFKIDDEYLDKPLELTELEIVTAVKYWYTRIEEEIFQDEHGNDLEEVCEYSQMQIHNLNKYEKV